MTNDILCCHCGKVVANIKGEVKGVTTWFAVCSECLFGVAGWRGDSKDGRNVTRR